MGLHSLEFRIHTEVLSTIRKLFTYIIKGLKLGRIGGPFDRPPFPNFVASPLGVVPKGEVGKYRVIHDLSFPFQDSVNSFIPPEESTVTYQNMDTISQLVLQFGSGCLMAKSDIEEAFRIIPIRPIDYPLLGFTWKGRLYYDKCLPMGASSSCNRFEALSTALQWVMENKFATKGIAHLLDDFFFIGAADSDECKVSLNNFLLLASHLNLPIKHSKTVYPTTRITIFGIEVDSVAMECRLPWEKVVKVRAKLDEFLGRRKTTLRELQSLIGLLNFACVVVAPGRAFLQRLIALLSKVSKPQHYIRLDKGAKEDIAMWHVFVNDFNGKALILEDIWVTSDVLQMATDASGTGCAGVLGNTWFSVEWPQSLHQHHISVKELFAIILACELWAYKISDKKIILLCDNIASVEVINHLRAKDTVMMRLVRRLVLCGLRNNIVFRARHVPGISNGVADALSRNQFKRAKRLQPELNELPSVVPASHIYI